MINILTIAVGLSMDAFSVSITEGAVEKVLKKRHILAMAFTFGIFQAFMPLIGWEIGNLIVSYFERYIRVIALLILSSLGIKMIFDAIKSKNECIEKAISIRRTFILAIVTSIDALAIGFTLRAFRFPIIQSILIIGVITFLFSVIGFFIGKFLGLFLKDKAGMFGGIILILAGIKIYLGF